MATTQQRLLATDVEYQDWFEKHRTLVFVAQMMFPVSFDGTGVSLNPAMRSIFFERNKAFSEPQVFIVPCAVVQEAVRSSHAAWLAGPGRGGRVRNDSPMRRIRPSHPFPVPGFPDGWMEPYRDHWSYLQLDPHRH
jgi:hypothetical protein